MVTWRRVLAGDRCRRWTTSCPRTALPEHVNESRSARGLQRPVVLLYARSGPLMRSECPERRLMSLLWPPQHQPHFLLRRAVSSSPSPGLWHLTVISSKLTVIISVTS